MAKPHSIHILGDFRPGYRKHTAIMEALSDASGQLGLPVTLRWIPSEELPGELDREITNGFFIPPQAMEYCENPDGVLGGVTQARERGIPLIATCGGAQLTVLEFARNILGLTSARLRGSAAQGDNDVFTTVGCNPDAGTEATFRLQGDRTVVLEPSSRAYGAYGCLATVEPFACNYGVNPRYQDDLQAAGLAISARGDIADPCIFELAKHPFFVAVTFLPQWRSSSAKPHPLLLEFLRTVAG